MSMRLLAAGKNGATASRIDVLGFGCLAVDELLYVSAYPPADAKAPVLRQERCFGGLVGNALIAAARSGARCAYTGSLGDDRLSRFAASVLREEGIDLSYLKSDRTAGPVHSRIIVGNDRGTRNIFFDSSRLRPVRRSLLREAVESARVLLIDHYDPGAKIEAVRLARRREIPVVADFEGADDPRFPGLLSSIDHLILSHDFAAQLGIGIGPAKIVRALWNSDRKSVSVTCGAKGCWFMTHDTRRPRHLPAFTIKTEETTGCGDVFHGVFAAGLARELPIEECFRRAAAGAALKASRPAGPRAIPGHREIERFLRTAAH